MYGRTRQPQQPDRLSEISGTRRSFDQSVILTIYGVWDHANPFRSTSSERSGAHMHHLFIDEIVEN